MRPVTVSGAVEHAWTEVFGHEAYAQDVPLNETGFDSLDKFVCGYRSKRCLASGFR